MEGTPTNPLWVPNSGGLRVPAAALDLKGFHFSARYFLALKAVQKGEKQQDGAKPSVYFVAGGRRRLLALTSHSLKGGGGEGCRTSPRCLQRPHEHSSSR